MYCKITLRFGNKPSLHYCKITTEIFYSVRVPENT